MSFNNYTSMTFGFFRIVVCPFAYVGSKFIIRVLDQHFSVIIIKLISVFNVYNDLNEY